MSTKLFSELPEKTTLAPTDFLVGFTSPTVDGERRWSGDLVERFVTDYIKTLPLVASAWVSFRGDGVAVNQSATVYGSYNVASVTRLTDFTYNSSAPYGGNGWRYQVNFAPGTMRNANYAVLGAPQIGFLSANGDDQIVGVFARQSNTVSNCIVAAMDMQARGTNTETSGFISLVFLGGQ